jgi:hypothetical protein
LFLLLCLLDIEKCVKRNRRNKMELIKLTKVDEEE